MSGREACLIGKVLGKPSVKPLTKAGDDDASINVLLPPGPPRLGELPLTLYSEAEPQGNLVKPQDTIFDIGRSYVSDEGHYKYLSPCTPSSKGVAFATCSPGRT